MATAASKQKLLTQVLGKGRKVTTGIETVEPIDIDALNVLEQVLYAFCREDATSTQADRAFQQLQERFFDWNEVRVSSIREIAEAFEGMSKAFERGERIVSFLQELFETTFSYDMDLLQKKGVKIAAKQLERQQAITDFIVAWVTQRSLGGHAVPVDNSTARCLKRLGLVDAELEQLPDIRAALEHLVPKAKNVEFTDTVSRVAVEMCHEKTPACPVCPLAGDCPSVRVSKAKKAK